jgi:hypothetical protein
MSFLIEDRHSFLVDGLSISFYIAGRHLSYHPVTSTGLLRKHIGSLLNTAQRPEGFKLIVRRSSTLPIHYGQRNSSDAGTIVAHENIRREEETNRVETINGVRNVFIRPIEGQ